jgi:hypothetical protein
MVPVDQRGDSDCLRACIASIFEVPYEDAPDTARPDGEIDEQGRATSQQNTVNEWLKQRGLIEWQLDMEADPPVLRRGVVHRRDGSTEPGDFTWPGPPVSYYVGSGTSPRGVGHAVVMRFGSIVHDPHPAKDMTIDRIDAIHVYVARL